MTLTDTIFAVSSGRPPAAIAIIRLSGPHALEAAEKMSGRALPSARRAALRRFYDPASSEPLDEGLLLCFPGPNTETGEDMVEFQCHGSHAVVRGIEGALSALPGLRPAGPGEFTRRAFLNGKMDLAGIEGLGDLIAAETALQLRAAMAMMGGRLSRRIEDWTGRLRKLAAQIEAQLDFSDEGDVADTGAPTGIADEAQVIAREMQSELAKPPAERLRDGVRVAIGGPPNAGKSSLFNYLVGREAAIVSPHAGTTRDVIEATINLRGVPVVLADSAGLRDGVEEVEQIGILRAEALLADADIVLWLGSPDAKPSTSGKLLQVFPKSDLGPAKYLPSSSLSLSTVTGEGTEALVEWICSAASSLLPAPGDYALSARQRDIIQRAQSALIDVRHLADEILIGECLRQAMVALDEITGRSTTDAVLDELFSGFCIGK
jgi:tRNA modification GTPase